MGMNQSCQKCGALIPANANACPVCHTSTLQKSERSHDNTAVYDAVTEPLELVRLRHRRLVVFLHLVFGFLGFGFYYLGFYRRGLIWFMTAIVAFLVGFFFSPLRLALLLTMLALQLGVSGYYGLNPDARDVRGELLG